MSDDRLAEFEAEAEQKFQAASDHHLLRRVPSELQAAVDRIGYWYHRIELPGGIITPGHAPIDASAYRIPDDLTGKTVLDIGSWDGYWTFDALKRGAKYVKAIDDFSDTIGSPVNADRSQEWVSFDLCRDALGYRDKCERLRWSVYDMVPAFGTYDTIFFFGTLYHLRHPLLALEQLRSLCSGTIHIETAIIDGMLSPHNGRPYDGSECVAEFYPGDEYGKNHSNWWVPTLRCAAAMVEAAGFRNVESWKLADRPQHISECRGFLRATV